MKIKGEQKFPDGAIVPITAIVYNGHVEILESEEGQKIVQIFQGGQMTAQRLKRREYLLGLQSLGKDNIVKMVDGELDELAELEKEFANIQGHDGMKADTGKAPMNLLPFEALEEVSKVLGFGAEKYSERGWYDKCTTIEDFQRYEASLIRHVSSWMQGKEYDEETGMHELAHLACNALFLLSLKNKFSDEQKGSDSIQELQKFRRKNGGMK